MGVSPLSTKAVFLDRDGVINRAFVRVGRPFPPPSLNELEILPDVPESLRLMKDKGFLLIVVTNQPDVGRGIQKRETVEEMHTYLLINFLWMTFMFVGTDKTKNVNAVNHYQGCCFRQKRNTKLTSSKVT